MTNLVPLFHFTDIGLAIDADFGVQVQNAASQWLMKAMLDTLPEIALILNANRQIVFVNGRCKEYFGSDKPEDILGFRIGDVMHCIHSTETQGGCGTTRYCRGCGMMRGVVSALNGRAAVHEYSITKFGGEATNLRVWTSPLEIDGKRYCAVAARDIADEKRRDVLERVFFNDVAMMAEALTSYTERLSSDASVNAALSGPLHLTAKRLLSQIDAQRIQRAAEQGELTISFQPVDANAFLSDLAAKFANTPAAAGRHIRVLTPALSSFFTSDVALLECVMENVIQNALEASVPGEYIQLKCSANEQFVIFEVHNNAFMPRTVQIGIFQRSFTTKGEGHGMGTYMMKLLSEQYLGGRVSFETSEAGGTTFYASYPFDLTAL